MSGSLFNRFKNSTPTNPLENIQNIISQVQQINSNPTGLGQLLLKNGRISQTQYEDISKMGNNYQQIAQYLIQSGAMPGNISQMNPIINQIQNIMRQGH